MKSKQTQIIVLEGTKTKLTGYDLDGDGKVDEVETLTPAVDMGIQPVTDATELGDTLKELNKDTLEGNMNMSGIDLRSRLNYVEISSILAMDALVAMRFCPTSTLSFTRQKKRLSVSLNGKGRDDIVNVVSGKRELDAKMGAPTFKDRVMGFFGGGRKNERID